MLTIKQQQIFLRAYKYYYNLKIDGIKGNGTINAIRNFQKDKGIAIDGIWGNDTENFAHTDAMNLQMMLNKYSNNYKISEDGIIGPATLGMIGKFQKENGLVADEIVGPRTFETLLKKSWGNFKYFKRSEFSCEKYCNGFPVEPNLRLVEILEKLRIKYNRPVLITSGLRCRKFNNELPGSAVNSAHLFGRAADIYIKGISRENIKKSVISFGSDYSYYGTKNMGNAVHVEIY